MMTFMVYYLIKNPETMRKLRAQIDEVLGDRPVQYEDFANLPYLIGVFKLHIKPKQKIKRDTAVMRETLRLSSTAPLRSTTSLEDTTIGGGKYAIKKGTNMVINAWELHRDPAIWGDDVRAMLVAQRWSINSWFAEGRGIPP
jgi:cytochrome P450/NADPH-cytochrome P450 reductase